MQHKETRLNIRANWQQKSMIARAAKLSKKTISNYMLEKVLEDAQAILGEESHFKLSEEKWQAFVNNLDSEPKNIPALRKLLLGPDIFDQESSR